MTVIFTATTPDTGTELWVSNGLPGGTRLLTDLRPGSLGSTGPFFDDLTVAGHRAYFGADDGVHGFQLWATDGTEAGTRMLTTTGYGDHIVALGNKVLFAGVDPANGSDLWVSDGTPTGTHLLLDISPGSVVPGFTKPVVAGGLAYFVARVGTQDQLWTTDGTAVGTQAVQGGTQGFSNPDQLTALGNKVIFSAITTGGVELYVSDGTSGGTHLLKDLSTQPGGSGPGNILVAGGTAYFTATDSSGNRWVYVTDGTTPGTKQLRDSAGVALTGGSFEGVALGSKLIFAHDDGVHGTELWVSTGTAAGTTMLADLYPDYPDSDPTHFTQMGGKVYFFARHASGLALWQTDGTALGTAVVKELPLINLGHAEMAASNGKLYFTAEEVGQGTGAELWVSDGTTAGTHLARDILPGATGSNPDHFADLGTLPGHAPTGLSLGAAPSVAELALNGTLVAAFKVNDQDPTDSFTFQLLDDAQGAFAIRGNKLVVANGFALDFEAAPTALVTVQVTDAALHTFTKTLTITLSDLAQEVGKGTAAGESQVGGAQSDNLDGLGGNDSLAGRGGNDTLKGGNGDDTLEGGAGKDRLMGGSGGDTYQVDNARDLVIESNSSTSPAEFDTVKSSLNWTLGANLEGLELLGARNLNGTGNGLDNVLRGNSGANALSGLAGADFLEGGLGNDTLTGGTGTDTFLFFTAPSATNRDTIHDFQAGEQIWLRSAAFAALGHGADPLAPLVTGEFRASANDAAQDGDDHILYNTATGILSYDADGNGSGLAVAFAVLDGAPTLTAADFMVYGL